jgi:hypothetical protein
MARANRASRRPQFVPQQFGRTTPSSARHPDDLLKAFAELVRGHLYDRGEFASLASICRFPGPDHVAHAFQVVMRFIRLNPKSGLQERRDAMPEPRTPPSLKAGTSSRTRMEKSAAGAHPPQRPSKLIAAENAADVGRGNRPRRAGRRRGGRGAPGKHSRECRNRGTGGSGPAGSIEGGIGNGIAGSAASGAARAAAGAWGRVGGQQPGRDDTARPVFPAGSQQQDPLTPARRLPSRTSQEQADSNGWNWSSTAINSIGNLTLCRTASIIASLLRAMLIPFRCACRCCRQAALVG